MGVLNPDVEHEHSFLAACERHALPRQPQFLVALPVAAKEGVVQVPEDRAVTNACDVVDRGRARHGLPDLVRVSRTGDEGEAFHSRAPIGGRARRKGKELSPERELLLVDARGARSPCTPRRPRGCARRQFAGSGCRRSPPRRRRSRATRSHAARCHGRRRGPRWPPERLCRMAKSSAKRSGCHCGTMLNSVPILMREVLAATKAPSRIPLGTVS